VSDDSSLILTFSSSFDITSDDLKLTVDGKELTFTLAKVSSTEYILYLSQDTSYSQGASLVVTVLKEGADNGSTVLTNDQASVTLPAPVIPKTDEEQTAAAVGSVTSASTTVAIASVTIAGFTSGSMTSAWTLINSLQLLGYIPMMNLQFALPVTELLKSLLFSFLPNSFKYFLPDPSTSIPDSAKRIDTDSSLFLLNAGDIITVLLASLLTVPIFLCLSQTKHERLSKYSIQRLQSFRWNFFLRFLIESYVELCFAAILQCIEVSRDTYLSVINSVLSGLVLLVCFVFPPAVLKFTAKHCRDFETDPALLSNYGSLFDEFKNDRGCLSCCYYALFLFRRLCYMGVLFGLAAYPGVQAVLCLVLCFPVSCT
jgi:hypothetical protein